MADIRIKDITTTASASLTGDFLPIDGSTGTRKLSAFSPTFGGNATVTGTLTVNGTGDSSFAGPLSWGTTVPTNAVLLYKLSNTKYGNGLSAGSLNNFVPTGSNKHSWGYMSTTDGTTYTEQMSLTANTGVLAVLTTTASTTTSTGALVVGNGTSGGLGVGGAIVAGGTITSTASTDSGLLQLNLVNSSTGTSASSLFRFNAGTRTATLQAYNDTHATLAGQLRVGTSNGDIVVIPSGVTAATFGSNTVSIPLSTASTSTSSGALVVSGGVGVAGAINAGTFYGLVDGVTAPATESGYARIYVDSADGDLKVKFGDGTVKTIATDS